jgi:hypothetical protein
MIYESNNKPEMVCLNDVYCVAFKDDKMQKKYASGIYTSRGELVQGTTKRRYGKKETDYIISPILLPKYMVNTKKKIEERIVYIGYLRSHYGHFIVDDLARLWWCLEQNKYKDLKVGYILDGGVERLPEYYIQCFEVLGIDTDRLLRLDEVTALKSVLIPEKSYSPGNKIYQCYFDTFEYISKQINSTHASRGRYEKIYLSRSGMMEKNDYGEKTMDQLARGNGFEVLHPEQMSFIDQVITYSNAKLFVSPNGTLAHNILWAGRECHQVILNRFSEENMHQEVFKIRQKVEPIQLNCYFKGSQRGLSCFKICPELKDVFSKYTYSKTEYIKYVVVFKLKLLKRLFAIVQGDSKYAKTN